MSDVQRSIGGRRGTGTRLVMLAAVTAMALTMLSAPAPAPATRARRREPVYFRNARTWADK